MPADDKASAQEHRRQWMLLVVLLLQVGLLWLPFGFRNRPIAEEWQFFSLADQGAGPLHPEPVYALRPLVPTWFYLIRAIDPDTLVGVPLFMMIMFVGKGWIAHAIARRLLPGHAALALLVGVLYVVYPADSGLFNFRAIAIHAAAFFYLLALYLLIVTFQEKRLRVLHLLLLCASLLTALLTYDSVYPLVFLSPVALMWLHRGPLKKMLVLAGLWYAVSAPLFANFIRVVFVQQDQDAYQTSVLDNAGLPLTILHSLWNAYRIHFYAGWRGTVRHVDLGSPLPYLAVGFGILVGWIVWKIGTDLDSGLKRRSYGALLLGGIAFVGLSILPYTITTARFDDWRIFYLSAFGAAVALVVLLHLVSRVFSARRRVAFALLSGACVSIAMLHALLQHQRFVHGADIARSLTADVVTQVPGLKTGAALFIAWNENSGSLISPDSIRYVYQDYEHVLAATNCVPLPETDIRNPPLWISCVFHPGRIDLMFQNRLMGSYSYENVILFRYARGERAILLDRLPDNLGLPVSAFEHYDPRGLIEGNATPTRRQRALLNLK